MLNNILKKHLDIPYIYYLNNILIYSKTKKQYIQDVQAVLTVLKKVDLQLKPKKYIFYIKKVIFLRYIILKKGIFINPKKVLVILDQGKLTNIKEV